MKDAFSASVSRLEHFLRAGKALRWAYLILALPLAVFGPYKYQTLFMLATVFAGASIFIHRTGTVVENGIHEKRRVALVMLVFIAINAGVTLMNLDNPDSGLVNDSGFWLASRILYLFGLAFFTPLLVEPLLETDDDNEAQDGELKDTAVYLACALFFVVLVLLYIERQKPADPTAKWYTSGMLADDIFMSSAVGLLVAVFTVVGRKGEKH